MLFSLDLFKGREEQDIVFKNKNNFRRHEAQLDTGPDLDFWLPGLNLFLIPLAVKKKLKIPNI